MATPGRKRTADNTPQAAAAPQSIPEDPVLEASEESFPASDAPGWNMGYETAIPYAQRIIAAWLSLSQDLRVLLVARIVGELTACARDTYGAEADSVAEPQVLRAYNELLHSVTAALEQQLSGNEGQPLESLLGLVRDFGTRYSRVEEMDSMLERAARGVTGLNPSHA